MKLRHGTDAVLVIWMAIGQAHAPVGTKPAGVVKEFLQTSFTRLDRFAELPDRVRENLLAHFKRYRSEFKSHIADPGERFNPTDVINTNYPMRRLVFAGASHHLWFIYYEHGGRGHHFHLTIYKSPSAEPVFAGRFTRGFKNGKVGQEPLTIDALKQRLEAGTIRDDALENDDW